MLASEQKHEPMDASRKKPLFRTTEMKMLDTEPRYKKIMWCEACHKVCDEKKRESNNHVTRVNNNKRT